MPNETSTLAQSLDASETLELIRIRALPGPNAWRLAPAVAAEIALGHVSSLAPDALHDGLSRLAAAFPPTARPSIDAMNVTTPIEAIAAATEALLESAGSRMPFERHRPLAAAHDWELVVGYDEDDDRVVRAAVEFAVALVRDALRGDALDVDGALATLRDLAYRAAPGPTTAILLAEARRRGIPVRRFADDHVIYLGQGRHLRRLDATMTDRTSIIATEMTSDKDRTKRLLERVGLPTPGGDVARTVEEAVAIADRLRYPVLIKPLDANNGRGISGRLDAPGDVRQAWPRAVAEHPTVVVERYLAGRDHRVLVVDGRVVAVTERIPAHVVGDGRSTVRALAEAINRDPKRSPHDPHAPLAPLPLDELTTQFLARSGRDLGSVPAAGEHVALRATANISTGGTAVDRTDDIHPDNVAVCELAAGAVGLDVAGLDVLTPDIRVPFRDNGAAIIEVNASPGLLMHARPDAGRPRDVAAIVIDTLYPPGAPARIPVLAITGTNGKTTTTRLIAHLFRAAGRCVGYTTTDGVYFEDRLLVAGDTTGPFSANVVLSHPRVEVAVLETARGGIVRAGLGFEACDVSIVLNVAADHLGVDGVETVEQLADVKGVLVAVTRADGYAVLNADDPLVLAMRARADAAVILFSLAAPGASAAVEAHLGAGGIVVRVEPQNGIDYVVVRDGIDARAIVAVADVPLTLGGRVRFQVANVLAAVAAAHAAGLGVATIATGLRTFEASVERTPGRMNLVRTPRGDVLLDYAHNPAAVAALVEAVRAMPAGRRIGVLAAPGDRRDEDLRAIGAAGAGLDVLIAKEHARYRRGRPPGETAARIAEGARSAGLAAERIETYPEEPAAVARALALMSAGDLVVIIADDFDAVLSQVRAVGAPGADG